MRKRLLKVKWENILLLGFIPIAIIQFFRASSDFKIISIMMSLILYGGIYYAIQTTRQEALLSVKYEKEQPIIKPILDTIKVYLNTKKEIIKQAIYKRPSLYILRACFK